MIFHKIKDGNGGKWILKRKFSFAAAVLSMDTLLAIYAAYLSKTPEQVVVVLGAYSTSAAVVLGLVFAADVVDKRINKDNYHAE